MIKTVGTCLLIISSISTSCNGNEIKKSIPNQTDKKEKMVEENTVVQDSASTMKLVLNAPQPEIADITGVWQIDSLYSYYSDGTFRASEDMHFKYQFNKDGTYSIDAAINSQGTWEFNKEKRSLIMIKDGDEAMNPEYIIAEPKRLQLIGFREGDTYISVYHRVE